MHAAGSLTARIPADACGFASADVALLRVQPFGLRVSSYASFIHDSTPVYPGTATGRAVPHPAVPCFQTPPHGDAHASDMKPRLLHWGAADTRRGTDSFS
jgi:hypothetical protein